MGYKLCPKCELNYIIDTEECCKICSREDLLSPIKHEPIVRKDNNPYTFMVFQGVTFDIEHKGGYIWAPLETDSGRYVHHWSRLIDLRIDDIIFHSVGRKIVALSTAIKEAVIIDRPYSVNGSANNKGRLVKCDYIILNKPLNLDDFQSEILKLEQTKFSPFDKNGNGNQGCLFVLNRELAKVFLNSIKKEQTISININ